MRAASTNRSFDRDKFLILFQRLFAPEERLVEATIFEEVVQSDRNTATMIFVEGHNRFGNFLELSQLRFRVILPQISISNHDEASLQHFDELL